MKKWRRKRLVKTKLVEEETRKLINDENARRGEGREEKKRRGTE